ncbi:MAG: ABC transporter ATP-binding protein [Elusimicrobiota bacterium]
MRRMYDEEDLGKAYDLALLRRFLGYLRPHWRPVAATLAVIAAGIVMDLAAPFLLRGAIDGPIAAGDLPGLRLYAAAFFVVIVLDGVFEMLEHYISSVAGQRIIYDLRAEVFDHLQRLPAAFYDRSPVGRLLTRVTSDVENLSELFTSGLVGMLSNALFLGAIVAAMLVVDWRLTLLTLAAVPFVVAGAAVFRGHARRTYRAMRQGIAAVTAYLNETLGGVKTIQIFNRQATCAERFAERHRVYRERAILAGFIYSFFWPGIELLTTLVMAAILWQAGRSILAGATTFGSFLAFWYLARKFFEPIRELAEKYNILQAAMASSERIFKLLDTRPDITAPERPAAPPRRGEIEFRDVSFSYDGETPVLKNVSFKVRPGEKVALVGYTGAGKTSVLHLLLRLYDATSGSVLVDGADVRDYDPRKLRRRFGTVFQDVFLFSGTVGENIRMGEDVPEAKLKEAVRLVNAEHVVQSLPDGYRSELRERGSAVSVGERQLLSFARALVSDPPILILDEATSSVDAETEGLIQEAMEKMMVGRTAVIVAHRLSTVRRADRILVLHHGTLREEGTHEELLKKKGLYEKLYRLQWSPAAA